LPPLAVGLAIFIGPRDYKIAYMYNMGLDEKAVQLRTQAAQAAFSPSEEQKEPTLEK